MMNLFPSPNNTKSIHNAPISTTVQKTICRKDYISIDKEIHSYDINQYAPINMDWTCPLDISIMNTHNILYTGYVLVWQFCKYHKKMYQLTTSAAIVMC